MKILLTGASGGGLALEAALLLARDHEVVAGAQTWPQVREVRARAAAADVRLEVIELDLLDPIDLAHAARSEPDIVVLNAALLETGSLVDMPLSRLRQSFDVNLVAHVDLLQRIVPRMIARRSGRIVWMSSIGAFVPLPFGGARAATKRAIEAVAVALRDELAEVGIRVTTIAPGPYSTGFNESGAESMWQWYDPATAHLPAPDHRSDALAQEAPADAAAILAHAVVAADAPFRTMTPSGMVEVAKQAQADEWNR